MAAATSLTIRHNGKDLLFWLDSAHSRERLAHCPFACEAVEDAFIDAFHDDHSRGLCNGRGAGLSEMGRWMQTFINWADEGNIYSKTSRILLMYDLITLNWESVLLRTPRFAAICREKIESPTGFGSVDDIVCLDLGPIRERYAFMVSPELSPKPHVFLLLKRSKRNDSDVQLEDQDLKILKRQTTGPLYLTHLDDGSLHDSSMRLFSRQCDADEFVRRCCENVKAVPIWLDDDAARVPPQAQAPVSAPEVPIRSHLQPLGNTLGSQIMEPL